MIKKVLIANRGEIACRIIRTCHDMGMSTVAIYSDADKNALHVTLADEAVRIGGNALSESYLNIENIINTAKRVGADAIHPGYGFLAENPYFAYQVKSNDLVWIGPSPESMEAMGDKRVAKLLLQDVPFIPGYFGDNQSNDTLIAEAEQIGYPIMVKATAGGGGKGMRLVEQEGDLVDALEAARREAKQAFGDDMLMLEKAILYPRHIEIQVFGDKHGNILALVERECSIQRRHQKIIEESPSRAISDETRQAMRETAYGICAQLGYNNAGTVEFLVDADENFYFMEMNTRLQVEHPVTEMIYDIDLVHWQIEVARGTSLERLLPNGQTLETFPQSFFGHAIEARVYAEDHNNDFLPVTGDILHWEHSENVRVDTGIQSGSSITPYYDPMIAKLIAYGKTRTESIRKLNYALSKTMTLGLRNNVSLLQRVLTHPEHLGAIIHTQFLDEYPQLIADDTPFFPYVLIAVGLAQHGTQDYWRNNANRPIIHTFNYLDIEVTTRFIPSSHLNQLSVMIGDDAYAVEFISYDDYKLICIIDGHRQTYTLARRENNWWVHNQGYVFEVEWISPLPQSEKSVESEGNLLAPMTGQVIAVHVEPQQYINAGDVVMIMEAMKMEHRIEAPYAGVVDEIRYVVGDSVQADAVLLSIQPEDTTN